MASNNTRDPRDTSKSSAQENGAKVVPFPGNGRLASSDRDVKKEILHYIRKKIRTKDGSVIEAELGTERLMELVETRDYEDLKKITDSIYEAWYWLKTGNFRDCENQLTDKKTLEKLYSSYPFKAHQLADGLYELCGRGDEFAAVVQSFFKAVMDNLDNRILWKPMVDELMALDGVSANLYFMGEEFPNYLQRWDEKVALLDEAIDRFGLREYARLVSGGRNVQIEEGTNFCTTSDGAIFSPAYMATYPDRERNVTAIKLGVVHECGHHKWRTFRINLHPDALKLDLVVARLGKETWDPKSGKKVHIIEAMGKSIEIKSYRDIMKIVKYPKMLAFLHNVADDKRIDALNMLNMEGLAEEYQQDMELILAKRPGLKGKGLGDILEGLLQQTVCGKTNGEIPEELKAKMQKLASDLSKMEIHEETDGTDSLNVALRWYVELEPELDALAARIKKKEDLDKELDGLLPPGFFGSETSIEGNEVKVVDENPGPIVLSKRKNKSGQRKMGIDPLSFLNLPGEKGEGEAGEGEPGEEGEGEPKEGGKEKPKGGQGAGGEHSEREEGEGKSQRYDEWAGTGYRKGSKVVIEHAMEGSLYQPPAYLRNLVKRMFRKYVPKSGVLVRGLESGEPDAELQEHYFEQVEAGYIGEPDYHADVLYQKSNVVVSVNIDISGSMAGRQIEVAVEGAAVVASASTLLKYPTEVGAFTGGDIVDYYVINVTKEGLIIPSSFTMNATPMAGALRHATARTIELKKRTGKRYAYQFWLCDGGPNCSGEGIDPIADTGMAVREARAKGIRLFGIIIASEEVKQEMEKYYQDIFGGGWYVVVESAQQILNPLLAFMRRVAVQR